MQDEEEEEEGGRAERWDDRPKAAPPDYSTLENYDLPTYDEAVQLDPRLLRPGDILDTSTQDRYRTNEEL